VKKVLRLGVLSDLHCHEKREKDDDSYLVCGLPTSPHKENPYSSLLKLIERKTLRCDFLLLPGDFADKVDKKGFLEGWRITSEIARRLGAQERIATIGNHDVSSRDGGNVFDVAKNIDDDFPVRDKNKQDEFWNRGFCLLEYPAQGFRILVINSAHHHYTEARARSGEILNKQLEAIEECLENLKNSDYFPFQVAMTHHHPFPHERYNLGSADTIINGTLLVTLLNKYNFKLIIHGHKHDVLLRYSDAGPNSTAIFSAGSFSCKPKNLLQGSNNTFHIVELSDDTVQNCRGQGIIETYHYTWGLGWTESSNQYFPHKTGFGCYLPVENLAKNVYEWITTTWVQSNTHAVKGRIIVEWDEVLAEFPEIAFLTPSTFEKFGEFSQKQYKMVFSYQLPQTPEVVKITL